MLDLLRTVCEAQCPTRALFGVSEEAGAGGGGMAGLLVPGSAVVSRLSQWVQLLAEPCAAAQRALSVRWLELQVGEGGGVSVELQVVGAGPRHAVAAH